jgi:peptide/nickel transport system permease protein
MSKAVHTAEIVSDRPLSDASRIFARNGSAVVGLGLLIVIVALSLVGPHLYGTDPFEIVSGPYTPPGQDGLLLGSDYLGRDVFAGILNGGRTTLAVGSTAALLTLFIGVPIGALGGYYGGWIDLALMRFTEFFQVLPSLLFAMVLVALFKPSLVTITIAIGVVNWTSTARIARGEFLRLRGMDFVRASRASGATDGRIVWRVILPNALPPLIVSATLSVGVAILFEGGLSFLGLGDPTAMTWGVMIGSNRNAILTAWWAATLPGLVMFLTVLSITLVGDGLNDALNPRLQER